MNLKRTIRLAAVAAVATAGMSTGLSSPAQAFTPMTTIGTGPAKPVVVWDHAAWKHCWSVTYAQWRKDGASPQNSQTAADWTCGTQP